MATDGWTKPESYESKARFCSYWHQLDEITRAGGQPVLEIGIGTGFMRRALLARGAKVYSVDPCPSVSPTARASVLALPFADKAFPTVACFQVLEHLHWDDLRPSLKEIARVCGGTAIISLPDLTPVYRLHLRLPVLPEVRLMLPSLRKRERPVKADEHFWEIGAPGSSLQDVLLAFQDAGLRMSRTFRPYENVRHRFFVCQVSADH